MFLTSLAIAGVVEKERGEELEEGEAAATAIREEEARSDRGAPARWPAIMLLLAAAGIMMNEVCMWYRSMVSEGEKKW